MTPSPMTAQSRASNTLTRHLAVVMSEPFACGAVAAFPGGIYVGNTESVICNPPQRAKQTAVEALEMTVCDCFVLEEVQAGALAVGPYAPNDPKSPKSYKTWRTQNDR